MSVAVYTETNVCLQEQANLDRHTQLRADVDRWQLRYRGNQVVNSSRRHTRRFREKTTISGDNLCGNERTA
jgi:hypothetical protein